MKYLLKNKHDIISTLIKVAVVTLIVGLFFSNALKSISLVTLAIGGLLTIDFKIKSIYKQPLFITSFIIVIVYCISAIFSTNHAYAFQSIQTKLLYVLVLLAFYKTNFLESDKNKMVFVAAICAVIQSLFAMYFFITQNTALNHIYAIGNVLPVLKIHHVQIAVLIAITIVLLLHFSYAKKLKNIEKYSALIIAFWLFIFLHIFAVRTGLVLVYFMLIIYGIVQLCMHQKWKWIFINVCLLLIVCGISLKYSSTLKNKINYTLYDINMFKTKAENAYEYSDSRRLISLQNGILLLKENPYFGVGVGDITDEISELYKKQNPTLDKKFYYLPHNQYLYFLSVFGYVLGIIVIICFVFPALYLFYKKMYLNATIYSALLLFSCWDAFIGTLFGNCLYLMVIGFSLKENN